MAHKLDFGIASSEAIEGALCARLESVRLSQNVSQAQLAKKSGISRRTLTRIASGQSVSLDTFIRVMQALGLANQFATLIPDPSIRPVDRIKFKGKERKRARPVKTVQKEWQWREDEK